LAGYFGAITVGRILVGFVVDRWGNRRIVLLGALLSTIGASLFTCAASAFPAAVALVLLGLGFAPIYPGLMHEVPKRFAPSVVQTIVGRQSGAGFVGAALLPALAGAVAQRSLEFIPLILVAGIVMLAAGIRFLDSITPIARKSEISGRTGV
jgi:predicted MFS family arabinose efflux permease